MHWELRKLFEEAFPSCVIIAQVITDRSRNLPHSTGCVLFTAEETAKRACEKRRLGPVKIYGWILTRRLPFEREMYWRRW
jgi:hypothetical protein